MADGENKTIKTLQDLADYLGANSTAVRDLNRRIYKDTGCGASISIYGNVGTNPIAFHNGYRGEYPPNFRESHFTIQSIVEGSDATVDSDSFYFGTVSEASLDSWIEGMEEETSRLWDESNSNED